MRERFVLPIPAKSLVYPSHTLAAAQILGCFAFAITTDQGDIHFRAIYSDQWLSWRKHGNEEKSGKRRGTHLKNETSQQFRSSNWSSQARERNVTFQSLSGTQKSPHTDPSLVQLCIMTVFAWPSTVRMPFACRDRSMESGVWMCVKLAYCAKVKLAYVSPPTCAPAVPTTGRVVLACYGNSGHSHSEQARECSPWDE